MNTAQTTSRSHLSRLGASHLATLHTPNWAMACVVALAASLGLPGAAQAQTVVKGTTATAAHPTATASTEFSTVGPALELVIGKSTLMRLPSAIERVSLGNPSIADLSVISPTELYLLGKNYGSTNLLIWRKGGGTTAVDVNVSIDSERMERKLRELLPGEPGIKVRPAANSVILTGTVSSAMKAKYAEDIANAFVRDINQNLVLPVVAGDAKAKAGAALSVGGGGEAGAKVVNLLQVEQAQQVMLEVKVAEVSKTLLDKLGANWNLSGGVGMTYSILSSFLSGGAGVFSITADNGNKLTIDAETKNGLIKILAEPNIISLSGQEASFLAGGKIYIPVARSDALAGTTVTLEEKEYGVGLKFTPTVLDGGRIHLKVAPEVSEISQTGSPFTTISGSTSVLPSMTSRRVQTTVQLQDGQSLAIAGLIKNNVSESFKRVPLLGEIPILGALFRSSEFQGDRSELMFLITPRLIKPAASKIALPTDGFVPPTRTEFFLNSKLEGGDKASDPAPNAAPEASGTAPQAAPDATTPKASAQEAQPGGYELTK